MRRDGGTVSGFFFEGHKGEMGVARRLGAAEGIERSELIEGIEGCTCELRRAAKLRLERLGGPTEFVVGSCMSNVPA